MTEQERQTLNQAKIAKSNFETWLNKAASIKNEIETLKELSAEQARAKVLALEEEWTALCASCANVINSTHIQLVKDVVEISISVAEETLRLQAVREEIQNL